MCPWRRQGVPGRGAGRRFRSKRQVCWALPAAAGARHVRALVCPALLAGPEGTSGCTRFWPGLHGFAGDGRQRAADIDRAGQAGARAATAGPGVRAGGFPGARHGRAHTGPSRRHDGDGVAMPPPARVRPRVARRRLAPGGELSGAGSA